MTTKGQTTVPHPIRAAMGLQVGKILVWKMTAGNDGKSRLTVYPSPSVDDLAGCQKSRVPFVGIVEEKRMARAARLKSAAAPHKRAQHR